MRLYPKRLRSIDDLEKEKKQLIQKSKKLDKEDFLSMEGLLGKKGNEKTKKDKKEGSALSALIDMLPISDPIVSMSLKMVQRLLTRKDKKPQVVYAPVIAGKKKTNKVKALAIEFVSGYLKWKAIELSYKGIKHLLNRRKERHY